MSEPIINGCDFFPEGTWEACCTIHDIAYYDGGGLYEKLSSDWNLVTCVWNQNPLAGIAVLIGISIGGWLFFRWGKRGSKNIAEWITGKKSGTI